MPHNRIIHAFVIPAFLTLVPLIASKTVSGWNWSPFDYVFFYALLSGAGVMYAAITQKLGSGAHRLAAAVAVAASLALVWINGAVGIIGDEDNLANVLYLAVPAIGLLGAAASRLQAPGLARTLFVMAFIQAMVPVVAFAVWRPLLSEPPGLAGVMLINAFFVFLFAFAGILFRNSSAPSIQTNG